MAERLSRNALYDLAWSEPLKTLVARFGISDVALKKTCARTAMPTPARGYWAKKEVGKTTFQVMLPLRPPGMEDAVLIENRGNNWYQYWSDKDGPLPPATEFSEPIEVVRTRITEAGDHATVLHKVLN